MSCCRRLRKDGPRAIHLQHQRQEKLDFLHTHTHTRAISKNQLPSSAILFGVAPCTCHETYGVSSFHSVSTLRVFVRNTEECLITRAHVLVLSLVYMQLVITGRTLTHTHTHWNTHKRGRECTTLQGAATGVRTVSGVRRMATVATVHTRVPPRPSSLVAPSPPSPSTTSPHHPLASALSVPGYSSHHQAVTPTLLAF